MPYLWRIGVVVLACLLATPLQAQSLAGGYSNVVGLGAMGGIIVFLLAWTQSLRRQLRRVVRPSGGVEQAEAKTQIGAPAALEEEHESLRALLENSNDCIYFKDLQSRFRRCSKAMCERFGISQDEVVGKSDFDFFEDDHARQAFADEQEIMRTGLGFHGKIEREEDLKDGVERWALTAKMPLRNKAGEIVGTFGISKDITDLKRSESQLAEERDLLTVLLDHTPDLIYFKDLQSRFVRVSQSEVEGALGRARALHQAQSKDHEPGNPPGYLAGPKEFAPYLLGKTDFDFYSESRARSAFDDEQEIIRTGAPMIGKLEQSAGADGKAGWLLTSKMPWRAHDGRIIGTFGISKDVTFIKEAETKLEVTHKQLVEASRVAGMAEVATTVLHNVGNVLNSVNISASLVADKVKNTKTANLARAAAMLQEHSSDLADFLTRDPKGSKLPAYFATLAECLATEQSQILGELSSLCANIEHIKEIVAMQQAYAKVAGMQESLHATDLIEDALRLNAGAFERHRVEIIREFAETPPLLVDKHKVLQILVNLLRNAKYALEDRALGEKRITLRTERGQNGSVKISIIDNGVGIAPENMTRIFEHGFTTRHNGHGFALHSGSLAARQMGGTLICHSDGPGQGASFMLELPLHPPEAAT